MSWTLIIVLLSAYGYTTALSIPGYSTKENCEKVADIIKESGRFSGSPKDNPADCFCVVVK